MAQVEMRRINAITVWNGVAYSVLIHTSRVQGWAWKKRLCVEQYHNTPAMVATR